VDAEAAAVLPDILRKSLGGRMTIASLVCVCVSARERACVFCAFVRSCVRAFVHVCTCVCVFGGQSVIGHSTFHIAFFVCVCVCEREREYFVYRVIFLV
jgi:hypothetical protein